MTYRDTQTPVLSSFVEDIRADAVVETAARRKADDTPPTTRARVKATPATKKGRRWEAGAKKLLTSKGDIDPAGDSPLTTKTGARGKTKASKEATPPPLSSDEAEQLNDVWPELLRVGVRGQAWIMAAFYNRERDTDFITVEKSSLNFASSGQDSPSVFFPYSFRRGDSDEDKASNNGRVFDAITAAVYTRTNLNHNMVSGVNVIPRPGNTTGSVSFDVLSSIHNMRSLTRKSNGEMEKADEAKNRLVGASYEVYARAKSTVRQSPLTAADITAMEKSAKAVLLSRLGPILSAAKKEKPEAIITKITSKRDEHVTITLTEEDLKKASTNPEDHFDHESGAPISEWNVNNVMTPGVKLAHQRGAYVTWTVTLSNDASSSPEAGATYNDDFTWNIRVAVGFNIHAPKTFFAHVTQARDADSVKAYSVFQHALRASSHIFSTYRMTKQELSAIRNGTGLPPVKRGGTTTVEPKDWKDANIITDTGDYVRRVKANMAKFPKSFTRQGRANASGWTIMPNGTLLRTGALDGSVGDLLLEVENEMNTLLNDAAKGDTPAPSKIRAVMEKARDISAKTRGKVAMVDWVHDAILAFPGSAAPWRIQGVSMAGARALSASIEASIYDKLLSDPGTPASDIVLNGITKMLNELDPYCQFYRGSPFSQLVGRSIVSTGKKNSSTLAMTLHSLATAITNNQESATRRIKVKHLVGYDIDDFEENKSVQSSLVLFSTNMRKLASAYRDYINAQVRYAEERGKQGDPLNGGAVITPQAVSASDIEFRGFAEDSAPTTRDLHGSEMFVVDMFADFSPERINSLNAAITAENRKAGALVPPEGMKVPHLSTSTALLPTQVEVAALTLTKPLATMLAHDTGLGKSLATIVNTLVALANGARRVLYLTKDSLLSNAVAEWLKFTDSSVNIVVLTDDTIEQLRRDKPEIKTMADAVAWVSSMPKNTIFITQHNALKNTKSLFDDDIPGGYFDLYGSEVLATPIGQFIKACGFDLVQIDEVHAAKSSTAQVTTALAGVACRAENLVMASGTPANNNAADLLLLNNLANPLLLGSSDSFITRWFPDGMNSRQNLGALINHIMHSGSVTYIARGRDSIAFVMPPFINTRTVVTLSKIQAAFYTSVLEEAVANFKVNLASKKKKDPKASEIDGSADTDLEENEAMLASALQPLEEWLLSPDGHGLTVKDAGVMALPTPEGSTPAKSKSRKKTSKEGDDNVTLLARKFLEFEVDGQTPTADDLVAPACVELAKKITAHYSDPSAKGKIMVYSINTVGSEHYMRHLPRLLSSDLSSGLLHYTAATSAKALKRFKEDPSVKVMICDVTSMSEGHNLAQYCRYILRTQSPWAPGALKQQNARAYRPDFSDPDSLKWPVKHETIVTQTPWGGACIDAIKMTRAANKQFVIVDLENQDRSTSGLASRADLWQQALKKAVDDYGMDPDLPLFKMNEENILNASIGGLSKYLMQGDMLDSYHAALMKTMRRDVAAQMTRKGLPNPLNEDGSVKDSVAIVKFVMRDDMSGGASVRLTNASKAWTPTLPGAPIPDPLGVGLKTADRDDITKGLLREDQAIWTAYGPAKIVAIHKNGQLKVACAHETLNLSPSVVAFATKDGGEAAIESVLKSNWGAYALSPTGKTPNIKTKGIKVTGRPVIDKDDAEDAEIVAPTGTPAPKASTKKRIVPISGTDTTTDGEDTPIVTMEATIANGMPALTIMGNAAEFVSDLKSVGTWHHIGKFMSVDVPTPMALKKFMDALLDSDTLTLLDDKKGSRREHLLETVTQVRKTNQFYATIKPDIKKATDFFREFAATGAAPKRMPENVFKPAIVRFGEKSRVIFSLPIHAPKTLTNIKTAISGTGAKLAANANEGFYIAFFGTPTTLRNAAKKISAAAEQKGHVVDAVTLAASLDLVTRMFSKVKVEKDEPVVVKADKTKTPTKKKGKTADEKPAKPDKDRNKTKDTKAKAKTAATKKAAAKKPAAKKPAAKKAASKKETKPVKVLSKPSTKKAAKKPAEKKPAAKAKVKKTKG